MERGRERNPLPDGDDPTPALGYDVDGRARLLDPGGADEHGVEVRAVDVYIPLEGIDLAAERVAAHGHVDAAERLLAGYPVLEPVGEHDHPGAGPERGQAAGDELAERVHQLERGREPPQRGRLAAGDHQAVARLDLGQAADRYRVRARLAERAQMLTHVALQGEHSDYRQVRFLPVSPLPRRGHASPQPGTRVI